jgi:hypothetical protein
MQYADQQVLSFTLDPTERVVEFSSSGDQGPDTWEMPLIGWAVISQPFDAQGDAHTSLEPVLLQDDQAAVTLSRVLSTEHGGAVTYRIRHRT